MSETERRPDRPATKPAPPAGGAEITEAEFGHPKGKLAIVLVYGLLFVLGWLGLYFLEFVPRGTPHP